MKTYEGTGQVLLEQQFSKCGPGTSRGHWSVRSPPNVLIVRKQMDHYYSSVLISISISHYIYYLHIRYNIRQASSILVLDGRWRITRTIAHVLPWTQEHTPAAKGTPPCSFYNDNSFSLSLWLENQRYISTARPMTLALNPGQSLCMVLRRTATFRRRCVSEQKPSLIR